MKKAHGDIIISHKRTKNNDHILYCSRDMACDRCNYFSLWAIFCPFTPKTAQKIKISKKMKKSLEISSFYTSIPKIMIMYYTAPEILVLHLLPLLNPCLIIEMQPAEVFSMGITLVDVHLNWLNWFHFLILKGGLLVILIDCMIFVSPFLNVTGLDKLHARQQACTQHAHKEIFTCRKLHARKSNKTPLSSAVMLFKVLSFLCLKGNNIQNNTI